MNPITIIGGGLAGLTLGILLRRHGCPVTLHEAGDYPRHRVCGEFISGPGVHVLKEMGLLTALQQRGSQWGRSAAFFSTRQKTPALSLPAPALMISRYQLDAFLAGTFVQEGGQLHRHSRRPHGDPQPGVVLTTGHRTTRTRHRWQWVGLKMHVHGVSLEADLEMHLFPRAYVGLCRIAPDKVNVCGLIRRHRDQRFSKDQLPSLLAGPPGTSLHRKLTSNRCRVETLCSTAGFDLRPHRAQPEDTCRLGDAQTMIAPLTGKGMSMAFESAHIAAPFLAAYSRGVSSWDETQQALAPSLNKRFSRRLGCAPWLNRLAYWPGIPGLLVRGMRFSPRLWRFLHQAVG